MSNPLADLLGEAVADIEGGAPPAAPVTAAPPAAPAQRAASAAAQQLSDTESESESDEEAAASQSAVVLVVSDSDSDSASEAPSAASAGEVQAEAPPGGDEEAPSAASGGEVQAEAPPGGDEEAPSAASAGEVQAEAPPGGDEGGDEGGAQRGPQIQGSFAAVVSDSESSEEDEDEADRAQAGERGQEAFHVPAAAADSDSEEEIEFGSGQPGGAGKQKKSKNKEESNPLADALGAAIADVEAGDGEADAFGIAYKPAPRSNQLGYQLPTGPAFADEREFERDLATSAVRATDSAAAAAAGDEDEDDEFGFEVGTVDAPGASPTGPSVREALERQRAKDEAEQRAIADELRREKEAAMPQTAPVELPTNALQELHDVYSAGLGDSSVREGEAAAPMDPAALNVAAPLAAMTEEDEEAFEAAEEQAERSEEAQRAQAAAESDAHAAEWAAVESLRAAGASAAAAAGEPAGADELIAYPQALRFFRGDGALERFREAIVPTDFQGGVLGALRRPKLKFEGAEAERDLLFLLAKQPYDPGVSEHLRLLRTVYRRLTGTSLSPPVFGGHWEDIGFQGTNPGTDLRDTGMLSVLQLLALVESDHDQAVAMLRLSQHEVNHWPMACVCINFSLLAMQALRSGALYPLANEKRSVFKAANEFQQALCFDFYCRLRNEPLKQFALVMADCKAAATAKPKKLVEALRRDVARRQLVVEAASSGGAFSAELEVPGQ